MADYSMQLDLAEDIKNRFNTIGAQLNHIGSELNSAINRHLAEFDGPTKDAFEPVQKQYSTDHEAMTADLKLAEDGLGRIIEEIRMGEQRGTAMWQM
jgi:uncharacterized protein YukE